MQSVRDAMFRAILDAFPGVTLYQDEIPQGFKTPCFYIKTARNEQTGELALRLRREYSFVVHYFPEGDLLQGNDWTEMSDKLMEILEYIEGGEAPLRRGYDIRTEVVDGVLEFFITYRVMAKRVPEPNPMNTLKHQEKIKDG